MTFLQKVFSRYWFPTILMVVVVTRIPFLWNGYGADADAWLVANASLTTWSTGNYTESRLPGYPLHEIISSVLVPIGGAPLSNGATLIATFAAIFFWFLIVKK